MGVCAVDVMTAISQIPGIGPWLPYIILAIVVCTVLAACLPPPTPTSSQLYQALYRLVQWVAFNIGHATNASDPASSKRSSSP